MVEVELLLVRVSLILPLPLAVAGLIPGTAALVQLHVVPAMEVVGLNVNKWLLHKSGGFALVKIGNGLTVTVTVRVPTQPFALVPVTVYVVVAEGETVTAASVAKSVEPSFQTYETAPLAVSVVLSPLQIIADDGVTVIVGFGFTVTVTVAVLVQPLASIPVTV